MHPKPNAKNKKHQVRLLLGFYLMGRIGLFTLGWQSFYRCCLNEILVWGHSPLNSQCKGNTAQKNRYNKVKRMLKKVKRTNGSPFSQHTFTCSKSAIETLEKGMKYIQS